MKKKQVVEMLDQVAEMSRKVHSIQSTQGLDSLCINKILNFCDWQHSATEKIMGIVESLERGSREQIHELEVSNQIQRAKAAAEYEWKIRSLEGRIKELEQNPKPVDFESLRGSFDELEAVRIEAGGRIEELTKANEELTRAVEDGERMRRNYCMALELESELLGKERERCKSLRVRAIRAEKILSEPCPNCGEPLKFPSQELPTEQELHESDSIGKSAVSRNVQKGSAD